MTGQIDTDEFCRKLYSETERFLAAEGIHPRFGFKILNGPPKKNAPYLFIGYQPGGRKLDAEREAAKRTDKTWPPVCEYATEAWRLAPRMRRIFGRELLTQCVGTNAIFLRYPSAAEYRLDVGTKRTAIETFCMEKVCQIVDVIAPQKIVTIGFAALQMFGPTERELKSQRGPILIKTGRIANRSAIGMIHLTGARISNDDLSLIARHFN